MKSFQVAEFNAPLQEVDQETPQPTGTQVLIKVKAAGVCHSDLHIWEGGYDLGHGRKPLSLKDRGVSLPRTMGHETVGEVVAFGPEVTEPMYGLSDSVCSANTMSRWRESSGVSFGSTMVPPGESSSSKDCESFTKFSKSAIVASRRTAPSRTNGGP